MRTASVDGADPCAGRRYDPPDRCMCCPILYAEPDSGNLLLFSQQSSQAFYGNGIVLRHVSSDAGATWRSRPVASMDFYSLRHQPVETMIKLDNGDLLMPSDNGSSPAGTAVHLSSGERVDSGVVGTFAHTCPPLSPP